MNPVRVGLTQKAKAFLQMHCGSRILVLPNAWDVISAKVFEHAGFSALGTTSAGISAALGYPDGQRMSLQENLQVVERIVRNVDIPVTADLEGGYATTAEGISRAARAALSFGVAGINIEDGTHQRDMPMIDISEMSERITVIRQMSLVEGIHFVLNARTDVFLVSGADTKGKIAETVKRGNAYGEAGADCIFVPDWGDMDRQTIATLVKEIERPLNIIISASSPPIAELEALGVARVSFGPRMMRRALGLIRNIAFEVREKGSYGLMAGDSMTYEEINHLLDPQGAH